jgi:chorismate synthase
MRNPFFCPDPQRLPELEQLIWDIRGAGDSIGARITVCAEGVPPGLGEPVFDKLDADIAAAMMGINAVKAVEIGDGVAVVGQRGSEHRDELTRRQDLHQITPAARSAAYPPGSRSWCI